MPNEESGGVVASQAEVVIGANWAGVEAAYQSVEKLDAKLKALQPNILIRIEMPPVQKLVTAFRTEMQAGLAAPFEANVVLRLHAQSLAAIQTQLDATPFTINVTPRMQGVSGMMGGMMGAGTTGMGGPGSPMYSVAHPPEAYMSGGRRNPANTPPPPLPPPIPPAFPPAGPGQGAYSRQVQLESMARGIDPMGAAVAAHMADTGMTAREATNALFDNEQDRAMASRGLRLNRSNYTSQRAAARLNFPEGVDAADFDQSRRLAEEAQEADRLARVAQVQRQAREEEWARVRGRQESRAAQIEAQRAALRGQGANYGGASVAPFTPMPGSQGRSSHSRNGFAGQMPDPDAPRSASYIHGVRPSEVNPALQGRLDHLRATGTMASNPLLEQNGLSFEEQRIAQSSSLGGNSALRYSDPLMAAQAARNARDLPAQMARNNFNDFRQKISPNLLGLGGMGAEEMALAQRESMRLQQDARRYFFAGRTMTKAFTLPTVVGAALLGYQGSKFDAQFGKIGALTETPEALIPGLKQQVIDMSMGRGGSRGMGVSASNLGNTLYQVASAGFTGAAGNRVTQASAKGEQVGLGDSDTIADVVTDVLGAYKLPAAASERIVNQLLKGVIFGKGEAASYAPALPKVISTAALAGVDFSQVMASMATMSRVGIAPQVGATGLNQLLMHIVAPTSEGTKAMTQLGWSPQSMKADLRDPSKGLFWLQKQVVERSQKSDNPEGLQEQLLGNARAFKVLASTSGVQSEAYAEALRKIEGGGDQLGKSLEITASRFDIQLKRVLNIVQGTGLELTRDAMPQFAKYVQKFADGLPDFIGKVSTVNTMAGRPGAALGVGGVAGLAALGPAFHISALSKDVQSWFKSNPNLLRQAAGVGGLGLGVAGAGYLYQRNTGSGEVDYGQLALAGGAASLVGLNPLQKLRGVSGWGEGWATKGIGLAQRGQTAYGAYALARAEAGLGTGLLQNAAGFAPWMVRGGSVSGGAYPWAAMNPGIGGGSGSAGVSGASAASRLGAWAGLGAAPSLVGMAGAASVVGLGVAAIGGYDYYRQTQREYAEREANRKAIAAGGQRIDAHFKSADTFAAASDTPEASQRLGDLGIRFAGARSDAEQLKGVLHDLSQYKIDLSTGKIKVDPLAGEMLKVDVNKLIKEIQGQLQTVEATVKIKTSWEGLKEDVGKLVAGQLPFQIAAADNISGVAAMIFDPLGWGRSGLQAAANHGIVLPYSGIDNESAPTRPAITRDAQGFTPRSVMENRASQSQFEQGLRQKIGLTVPASRPNSETDAEKTLQGILGIQMKNGADRASFIDHLDKSQIGKLQGALLGDKGADSRKALGDVLIKHVAERYRELKNAPETPAGTPAAGNVASPEQLQALEIQRKGLEGNAEKAGKMASAYSALQGVMDGQTAKLREYADQTERTRAISELYKRSLDGVDDSYKKQAISVAGLLDRMKELAGLKNTLRGFNESLEAQVSGVGGDVGALSPYFAGQSALLDYPGRQGRISAEGNRRSVALGELAYGQSQAWTAQQRDYMAQAGALGADAATAGRTGMMPGDGGASPSYLVSMERDKGKVIGLECGEALTRYLNQSGFKGTATSLDTPSNAVSPGSDGKYGPGTIFRVKGKSYPKGHYMEVGSDGQHWTEANYGIKEGVTTNRLIDWKRDIAAAKWGGRNHIYTPSGALQSNFSGATASITPIDNLENRSSSYGGVKTWVADSGNRAARAFHLSGIGGVGKRGNESDHPGGLALDFPVPLSSSKGNQVASYFRAHAAQENAKYVIWNDKIWSKSHESQGWRDYVNPQLRGKKVDLSDPKYNTLQHRDHVHVSYENRPGSVAGGNVGANSVSLHLDGSGKSHLARPVGSLPRDAKNAPANPARFDTIDNSLASRSGDLQWALGKRQTPNKYNSAQFALQQLLESKNVQEQFAEFARVAQLTKRKKGGLSAEEAQMLSNMSRMNPAQLQQAMASHNPVIKKIVNQMAGAALRADRIRNEAAGTQEFYADQQSGALARYGAAHPLDLIGQRRLELRQDGSVSPIQRAQMMGRFVATNRAGEDYGARMNQGRVNDAGAGLRAASDYRAGNPNWSEEEAGIAAHMKEFQAQTEREMREKYLPKGQITMAGQLAYNHNVSRRVGAEAQSVRQSSQAAKAAAYARESRESDNALIDGRMLADRLFGGADSELAGLDVARQTAGRNSLQSGRSFADGDAIGKKKFEIGIQGIENSNLARYNEDIKALNRSMASLGDTTGVTAKAMELWDDKAGMGLSQVQKMAMLTATLSAQQAQARLSGQMQSAPLFSGPGGARNDIEAQQAQLEVLQGTRQARRDAILKASPGIGADAMGLLVDAPESELRQKIEDAKRNTPRQARNDIYNRGQENVRAAQEQIGAAKALTDQQKVLLYIDQERNRFKAQGLDFDEEALKLAREAGEASVKANAQIERANTMRGFRDDLQGVTGNALQSLFNRNGSEAAQKRAGLRGEDERWLNMSMDLSDRGYGHDSEEYKIARKRHKELSKSLHGGGMLGDLVGQTAAGWGQSVANLGAKSLNDYLWKQAGGGLSDILMGGTKPQSAKSPWGALLGGITGFNGSQMGAGIAGLLGDKGGNVANSVQLNAQNVYLNGVNQGSGSLTLGGGSSRDQTLGAIGEGISLISRRR